MRLDLLSNESLMWLDQAPGLSVKDSPVVISYIESLNGVERMAFLAELKEVNSSLHEKYTEHMEEAKRIINQEIEKRLQENRIEKEKQAKKFNDYWTTDRFNEEIRKINPNYCGLLLCENRHYYKLLDFAESVKYAFEITRKGYDPQIVLSLFLGLLKKELGTDITFSTGSYDHQILILCNSPESRGKKIEEIALHNKNERDSKLASGWGEIK